MKRMLGFTGSAAEATEETQTTKVKKRDRQERMTTRCCEKVAALRRENAA
jgi:hypothetical protein